MNKRLLSLFALIFAFALVAAACGDSSDEDESTETTEEATDEATETTEEVTEEETTEETTEEETTDEETDEAADDSAEEGATGTVVDVAVDSGQFPTLVAALEATGLDATLAEGGPYTVFAPTEDAFAAALTDLGITAEELLASQDLAGILSNHVLAQEADAEAVVGLDGTSVATLLDGNELAVAVDGETVTVNDATVVQTDILASNGVIHVIDTVLMPTTEG